jgi:hypothetical protein
MVDRIGSPNLCSKIISADDAAAKIVPGVTVGMSGFMCFIAGVITTTSHW